MSPADMPLPADSCVPPARVGYVCKVYPRFSETFILTEILAHERAGLQLEIFSLRPPLEGRFHERLADVRSPVTYLDADTPKVAAVWAGLQAAMAELPGTAAALSELFAAQPREAVQAVALARAVQHRDLTHLHAHFGSVATSVARLAAMLCGVPYSFTAHAKDIFHDSVDRDDLRRKARDAAAVITVSDFNAAHLRTMCGQADVHRIYNGLDLARFPYQDPARRPAEVVSVGRLVEKKGMSHLVEAVGLLQHSHPELQCTIVGGGPLEADLRHQIAAADLTDRIRLTGPLPQAEVRRIIQSAAVFAAPCIVGNDGNRDGLPTVLLEAMALGTPCVSTDVTGIPEVLVDEVSGLAVRQSDAPDLAGAIARLVDHPPLRSRLATRARHRIEQDFDTDRQAARLRSHFVDVRAELHREGRLPALAS